MGDTLLFEAKENHLLVTKKRIAKLAAELPLRKRGKPVHDVHEWREIAKHRSMEDKR